MMMTPLLADARMMMAPLPADARMMMTPLPAVARMAMTPLPADARMAMTPLPAQTVRQRINTAVRKAVNKERARQRKYADRRLHTPAAPGYVLAPPTASGYTGTQII
ncbi:uncharacterized protein LOC114933973 [Nylanderia fulva]|uniref:uncharacterized protein LOC114933973 n=1 Tax=Nylanderia fulva TaxID=613905 RepID=UPI0010FB2788|nr:uncharacterized protein LOC114933973 [Nylanderia fulva]